MRSMVWYAWRAAGGGDVDGLMDMLEEATADGMFGLRGASPGAAAWEALEASPGRASSQQGRCAPQDTTGRGALVAKAATAQGAPVAPR